MNRQQGNGDSGRFVQRRGHGNLITDRYSCTKVPRIARLELRVALLAGAMGFAEMLVCAAHIPFAAACAVPAFLSPHPTASLRSASVVLIPGMSVPQVAASSTSLEADRYDHYISHRKCTVRSRNHRPLARLDRARRLQRIATARTLLTAHSLWPLVCVVAKPNAVGARLP